MTLVQTHTQKPKSPRHEVRDQWYAVLDKRTHAEVLWYFIKRDRVFLLWAGLIGSNALWIVQYIK